jgi:hypothetical protein
MSAPKKVPLSELSRGELETLLERLLAENAALEQALAELRAEVAALKGLKRLVCGWVQDGTVAARWSRDQAMTCLPIADDDFRNGFPCRFSALDPALEGRKENPRFPGSRHNHCDRQLFPSAHLAHSDANEAAGQTWRATWLPRPLWKLPLGCPSTLRGKSRAGHAPSDSCGGSRNPSPREPLPGSYWRTPVARRDIAPPPEPARGGHVSRAWTEAAEPRRAVRRPERDQTG